MKAKRTKTPPNRTWTAHEALSWGMFGDEKILTPSSITVGVISPPLLQRTYNDAQLELRDAIAKKTVEARGFKVTVGQPSLARETLPSEMFERFRALAVDAFGETAFMRPPVEREFPKWNGIIFDDDKIRTLWPKPTPNVDQWMKASVLNSPDEKRDSRISDCRKATGCTDREAKAAYDRLPPNMKRGRGQKVNRPAPVK